MLEELEKTLSELEKTLSELEKTYEEKEKTYEEKEMKWQEESNTFWTKKAEIEEQILNLKLKDIVIEENSYYYKEELPLYHYFIFLIYKVVKVNKRNINVIEYRYRSDDGKISFRVDESTKNKDDFFYMQKISEEEFNEYINNAINLKIGEKEC